ncbi:MAG: hydantoinase/oxoprolinase family protein, partial [Solirubrobacterales bacterium]
AALHQVGATDAVVVECGGTSTNVSVVRHGRPALRSIKVMGRPTAIRSIDSWVVGVAGGSMLRLGRRGVAGIGPRSAHMAGLPYACFAGPEDLQGARPAMFAPRPGDPADYAAVDARGGRFAVTATCAANALGCVDAGGYAAGSREAAVAAFEALATDRRISGGELARAALDAALSQIEASIEQAARSAGVDDDAPLIALGGAGAALVPELGRRVQRPVVNPEHQEVLASVGAALTLIRVELARSARATDSDGRAALVRDAEIACVGAGAAPGTITVETAYDADHGLLRATGTGAVALESGAAGRAPLTDGDLRAAAAATLSSEADSIELLSAGDFYVTYATRDEAGALDRAAIVDRLGSVPVVEPVREVVVACGAPFMASLERAIESASLNLGIASVLPRVSIACGPQLLDLSNSRRAEDLLSAARDAVTAHGGEAVAVVSR